MEHREGARHLGDLARCCSSTTGITRSTCSTRRATRTSREDTYRTLSAADSAVMLIDAAKGVEPQTIKLFKVCRLRGIPIFTFVNKLDRYGRAPLELMDELEKVLGIRACPMNWPIGSGPEFRGRVRPAHEGSACLSAGGPRTARPRSSERMRRPRSTRDRPGAQRATSSSTLQGGASSCSTSAATSSRLERVLRGRAVADVLRLGDDQLRRAALPRRLPRDGARRRRARPSSAGLHRARRGRTSPASSSRFRRTWTPRIATASPSCAWCRGAT